MAAYCLRIHTRLIIERVSLNEGLRAMFITKEGKYNILSNYETGANDVIAPPRV